MLDILKTGNNATPHPKYMGAKILNPHPYFSAPAKIKGINMIEKLNIDPIQSVATNHCIINKINEIVDTVNAIQEEREAERFEIQEWIGILEGVRESVNVHEKQIDKLQMKIEPEKLEIDDTDDIAEVKNANLCIKSMLMDKEFAEEEMERLQKELDRTKKQLEFALNCLDYFCKYIDCDYICGYVVKAKAKETLEQITALEQKDVK